MKIVVLSAVVVALLCFASASDAPNAKTFPADAIKTISIYTDSGAITLNVSADKKVSTDVSPAGVPGNDCVISQELKDGTLTLAAHLGSKSVLDAAKGCSSGFAVLAPASVSIKARSSSGNVELGAFSGKTDVQTSSGTIALHGASGALTLRTGNGNVIGRAGGQEDIDVETGSGNVYLRGLTGSIKARSDSGAIALTWADTPQVGHIDVRTVSGDFAAKLSEDAEIKILLKSASGKVRSEFSNDAAAPLSLSFHSGSGYATLKKRKRANDMQEDIGSTEVFDREDLLRW
jgi:hypothetical protein